MEEVPDGDAGEDSITKGTEASESATEMMVCFSYAVFMMDRF